MRKFIRVINNTTVRNKLLFTIVCVLIYVIGTNIPLPNINRQILQAMVQSNSMLQLYNLFSGGSFANFTIFALGIGPFITASIIVQLLTVGFESLKDLQKCGEHGKKQLDKITYILTFFLSILQGYGIINGIVYSALTVTTPLFIWFLISVLVTCSMFVAFMANKMTKKGIGNGSSVLILVSILSRIPYDAFHLYDLYNKGSLKLDAIGLFLGFLFITIYGVVFINDAVKKVPVEYAKRTSNRDLISSDITYLPIKVNQSGVMPIIFATSVLALPQTLMLFNNTTLNKFLNLYFNPSTFEGFWVYRGCEIILIIAFSYFYNTIAFNVDEITKNLKHSGAYIPGIKQGSDTKDYLSFVLARLTVVGALFLGLMAFIPVVLSKITNVNLSLSGTTLLILVGVALELKKQVSANIAINSYDELFEIFR